MHNHEHSYSRSICSNPTHHVFIHDKLESMFKHNLHSLAAPKFEQDNQVVDALEQDEPKIELNKANSNGFVVSEVF